MGAGISHGQHATGPTLTRTELADCLALQDVINDRTEWLDADEAKIAALRHGLDRTDSRAVIDFNNKVSAYNDDVSRLDSTVDLFNSACAGKEYFESDLAAAEAESKLPVQAPQNTRPATR